MRIQALALTLFLGTAGVALGQGTFIYDQRSAPDGIYGESPVNMQRSPLGQSFTPTLSSAQFVQFYISDRLTDGFATTVYLNLRSDSITGTVLSSTAPVFLADGFHGPVTFLFGQPLSLIPGTEYFLEPVVQSGQSFLITGDINFGYSGGRSFVDGTAAPTFDFWFAEGIIVPEPSTVALVFLGFGMLRLKRGRRQRAGDRK